MPAQRPPLFGPDLRGQLLQHRCRLQELVGSEGSGNVYAAHVQRLPRSSPALRRGVVMLTRRCATSPRDGFAFAQALRARTPRGRSWGAPGEVLAELDDHGRFTAAPSVTGSSKPPADGWCRTAEDVVCYVHDGRPFSLRCGERLVVAPLDVLPMDALAVPDDEVDAAFQQAGADLIEVFWATGGE